VFYKRNKKIFNFIIVNFQYTTYNLKNLKLFRCILSQSKSRQEDESKIKLEKTEFGVATIVYSRKLRGK